MVALPSMRPAFEPAASSLDARKLSLPYLRTLQRIEHVVVNSRNVTSRLVCANSIADEQTRSSRKGVYRDHDRTCRGARPWRGHGGADVSVLQPVSCGGDIIITSLFQTFEILTPAPCAHRTGRSRIVSLCGKV